MLFCIILFAICMYFSNRIESIFHKYYINKFKNKFKFVVDSKLGCFLPYAYILLILALFIYVNPIFKRMDLVVILAAPIILKLVFLTSNDIEKLPVIVIQNMDVVFAVDCSESMSYFDPNQKTRKDLIKMSLHYFAHIEKLDRCFKFETHRLNLYTYRDQIANFFF
jgi:hypothetical protein